MIHWVGIPDDQNDIPADWNEIWNSGWVLGQPIIKRGN